MSQDIMAVAEVVKGARELAQEEMFVTSKETSITRKSKTVYR